MQRLIKNSSSPPVHKAQARAAFCLLCHFPNRPRLELPLHRLCSSTALFPSSLSRCKGPPRTVFRLSWFTRPIWGERREFQWNIDAALLHLVFDTQGDLSTHEYKHNALMFLFFPSKRRREKKWTNFLFRIDKFFLKLFPTCFILFNLTYWTTLVFFWSLFSRRLWSKTSWAKKTIHAIAKSPPTK